jgi:outer membrane receptor protein involved in Fe transport
VTFHAARALAISLLLAVGLSASVTHAQDAALPPSVQAGIADAGVSEQAASALDASSLGQGDAAIDAGSAVAPLAPTPSAAQDSGAHAHEAEHVHAHSHTYVHAHPHAADEPHVHEYAARASVKQTPRASSSYVLQKRDLPRGAHVTPGDLLRSVPGMLVVQHAGGGKANQYFLRGFDADHGSDVSLNVDGVPVNMVSHGHGQGYADMNWVIPELVVRVDVSKGANDPRYGDFATAGAIDLQTGRKFTNQAKVEAGMFNSYRGLVLLSHDFAGLRFTGAGEATFTDGPFRREENLRRGNLFARLAKSSGPGELTLTLTSYLRDWRASGQIPLRAVKAGTLDRFGYVDPHEGGNSTRTNLYARYRSDPDQKERWDVLVYGSLYRFSLYANFSFYSDYPERGDMIHQRDERYLLGFKGRYRREDELGPFTLVSQFGLEMRHDDIDNGLEHAPARVWQERLVDANVVETSMGLFIDEEMAWLDWLHTNVALRADGYLFSVASRLPAEDDPATPTSGERGATQLSPKAGVRISPLRWFELFANLGYGFHSNDARGVIQGVTPLTSARGYEVGATASAFNRLWLRLTLFRMDLGSELVWVGDAGTTEARGRTRRDGIEIDARADILSWLRADVSVALTRARFRDAPADADAVPLAPRSTITGKLTATHPKGYFGRVSVLSLGDRPATEDEFLTATGFTRVDLMLGYQHPRFELALGLENLLNTTWREAQFGNVSRLQGEGPESCAAGTRAVEDDGRFKGCEDIHFTPGTPFAVRGSASIFF